MKPYTFGEYGLYAKDVDLRNGNGTHRIYFFSKNEPKSGMPTNLPPGYRIEVSPRTGLPLLRRDATVNPRAFGWLRRYFN